MVRPAKRVRVRVRVRVRFRVREGFGQACEEECVRADGYLPSRTQGTAY